MNLSKLRQFWRNAASIRDLTVRMPFTLALEDGSEVHAEVLLEGFGAPNGMLIVTDSRVVFDRSHEIISAGYGYSCMSPPDDGEINAEDAVDELLEDWGAGSA